MSMSSIRTMMSRPTIQMWTASHRNFSSVAAPIKIICPLSSWSQNVSEDEYLYRLSMKHAYGFWPKMLQPQKQQIHPARIQVMLSEEENHYLTEQAIKQSKRATE